MSTSIKVWRRVTIDPMVLLAVRLMGRRDIARNAKDWEESDLLRELVIGILTNRGCEHELEDVKGETSILRVRIPLWFEEFVDTTVFERAAEFVGWQHDEKKCGAWRCRECGRVTNNMPMSKDVMGVDEVGPPPCPWCGQTETYDKLAD